VTPPPPPPPPPPPTITHIIPPRAPVICVLRWRETLAYLGVARLTLHFVGPEVAPSKHGVDSVDLAYHDPPKEISAVAQGGEPAAVHTMRLHYHHALYHELEDPWGAGSRSADPLPPPDLIWLSNPGIGHPHLAEQWAPSLERALQTGIPLVLTSHSAADAARDVEALGACQHGVEWLHPPQPNPFKSLKLTPDPLSQVGAGAGGEGEAAQSGMVQANYGWMGLRGIS